MLRLKTAFHGKNENSHLTVRSVEKIFDNAVRSAGVTKDISIHSHRHSFATQGFQSTNVIGGPQKTKDIELLSPVTNERILVQVKCSSSFKQYEDYETRFSGMEGYDRFFYVVHTPDKKLSVHQPENKKIEIWKLDKLSELTINAGLTSWVINKIG